MTIEDDDEETTSVCSSVVSDDESMDLAPPSRPAIRKSVRGGSTPSDGREARAVVPLSPPHRHTKTLAHLSPQRQNVSPKPHSPRRIALIPFESTTPTTLTLLVSPRARELKR